jgi:hypothetical protein
MQGYIGKRATNMRGLTKGFNLGIVCNSNSSSGGISLTKPCEQQQCIQSSASPRAQANELARLGSECTCLAKCRSFLFFDHTFHTEHLAF